MSAALDAHSAETASEPPQRNPTLSLVSAVLAVVAAIAALLSPTQQSVSEVSWESGAHPDTMRVDFIDPVEVVEVSGKGLFGSAEAASISTILPGDPIPSGQVGLRITLSDEGVQGQLISSDGSIQVTESLRIGGDSGGFPNDWTLRLTGEQLELGAGNSTVTPIFMPSGTEVAFSGIHREGASIDAVVRAYASGLNSSSVPKIHTALLMLSLALVLATVLLSAPAGWFQKLGRVSFRIRKPDVFVIVAILFSAFVSRTTYDDGWVLQRARLLAEHWGPSTLLIDPYLKTPMPQGFAYESLLAWSAAQTTLVLGMRIGTVVLSIVLWFVISKRLIPRLWSNDQPILMWIAAAYIGLWSLGWMSLRAEIPVAVLSAVLLSLGLSTSLRAIGPRIAGVFAVTGLGVATHQSGLILIPAAAVLLIPLVTDRACPFIVRISGVLSGLALALAAGFTNQNLDIALRSVNRYGGGVDVFDQWERFFDMFRIGTVSQRAWFLAGIVGVLALWIFVLMRVRSTQKWHSGDWLFAAAASMPFGLAFTSSKWHYHFSALVVPMLLGLLILAIALTRQPYRRVGLATVLIAGFTSWLGISIKDSEFDSQFTALIVVTTLTMAMFVMFLPFRSSSGSTRLGVLAIASTMLLGAVTLWNAMDLAARSENNWSFLAQATTGMVDSSIRCGMVTQIADAPDSPGSMAVSRALSPDVVTELEPSLVLVNPCFDPPGIRNGQWFPQTGFALEFFDVRPEAEPEQYCADFPHPVAGEYSVCLREFPSPHPQLIGSGR